MEAIDAGWTSLDEELATEIELDSDDLSADEGPRESPGGLAITLDAPARDSSPPTSEPVTPFAGIPVSRPAHAPESTRLRAWRRLAAIAAASFTVTLAWSHFAGRSTSASAAVGAELPTAEDPPAIVDFTPEPPGEPPAPRATALAVETSAESLEVREIAAPPLPSTGTADEGEPTSAPPGPAPPFDGPVAMGRLASALAEAAACTETIPRFGSVHLIVTFGASGAVQAAYVYGGALRGNAASACIDGYIRSTKIEPFSGGSVTVRMSVPLR